MQFFTMEIWEGIQDGGEAARPWHALWDNRVREYWAQYAKIRDRLEPREQIFFDKPRLHDGRIKGIQIEESRSRVTPLAVTLDVAHPEEPRVYRIAYRAVTSLNILTPPNEALGRGFDDWGYDEITSAGEQLRHEVLLAPGIEISIVFGRVRVTSRRDRNASAYKR